MNTVELYLVIFQIRMMVDLWFLVVIVAGCLVMGFVLGKVPTHKKDCEPK